LGARGDVGDDLLGHPVQQRQRAGHHPAGLVDVLHARPDELGVAHDRPHRPGALLQVPGDPGEQGAHPVQVERQPGDQQDHVDDREDDQDRHDFTLPSTRPRNRWCLRPSASTRSTPSATCGISAVSAVFASAALSVSRTWTTRRSMIFTSQMSTLSRAATATTTTRPRMLAVSHRLCSVEDIARSCIVITQPRAAALQAADDGHRVLDRGAQPAQRRGVLHGLGQRVVDLRCLIADGAGQQQDRHDQRDDDQGDHDAYRVAHDPAGGRRPGGEDMWFHDGSYPGCQTVSQKSRTGFRLALTEVSRSGTVLVGWATACTPPVVATSVLWIARRWKITRSRPSAVIAMISAAMTIVAQAAAGMAFLLSAEKLGDGARVPDRTDGYLLDSAVVDGQPARDAAELTDQLHPPGEDVVGGGADPLQRGEHAVEQEDDHGKHY